MLMFKGVPIVFDKQVDSGRTYYLQAGEYYVNNPKACAVLTGITGFNTECGYKNCLMLFGDHDGRTEFLPDTLDRWTDPWSGQEYGRVGPDVFMVDPNVKGKYEVKGWYKYEWKSAKWSLSAEELDAIKSKGPGPIVPLLEKKIKSFMTSTQKALDERVAAEMFSEEPWWILQKRPSTSSTGS